MLLWLHDIYDLYVYVTSQLSYMSVSAYKSSWRVDKSPIHTFIMSKTSLHLVGDSNVIRYLPLVKSVKDDPYIQDSTMSRAVNVVQLEEALTAPAKVTPVVIVAALTNPIISYPFEDYTGMLKHCERFFSQVKAWIAAGRSALPGTFEKVRIFLSL